jgi:hypothetical protein
VQQHSQRQAQVLELLGFLAISAQTILNSHKRAAVSFPDSDHPLNLRLRLVQARLEHQQQIATLFLADLVLLNHPTR